MRLLTLGLVASVVSGELAAQDLSVPADPVAAIEGDWNGIWDDWAVTVTNGRVVLTKADPDNYNWIPVGTVLGVLNNNGKSEPRTFRFSGSTCLDHRRDLPPSEYKVIPCGDYGAVLGAFTNSYELHVSGISLRRPRNASSKSTAAETSRKTKPPVEKAAEVDKPAQPDGPSSAELAAQRHEAVEQRNREKQAQYEAEMKAWQAQIDAQKAEEERKTAKLAADKQQAAQQLAAFADRQEAHRQEMERHAQLLLEHRDAQQRHALCSAGDRAACEALANGKLAEAAIPQQDASTDTDARMCMTEPVVSPNEAFKGSLKAVVVNGCEKPVDVRICLMSSGGWDCGMRTGLKPQEDWTWWTLHPQDGIFWDARTSGSNRKLGSPQG